MVTPMLLILAYVLTAFVSAVLLSVPDETAYSTSSYTRSSVMTTSVLMQEAYLSSYCLRCSIFLVTL